MSKSVSKPFKPHHIAVLMGGLSSERPVSLNSGAACAKALEGEGFKVTRVDVGWDIAAVLSALKPDAAFNALHGPYGEDGIIQGVLEMLKIPYTHSGVMASALAMNKVKARDVMKAAGVPVAQGLVASRFDIAKAHVMPPPYVVKPIAEGSSVGVIIVREGAAPPKELAREDWPHPDELLVEQFIAGRELTCGVMDGKALGVTEITTASGDFYDYDAKYAPGGSIHILPAPLKQNIYQKVQEYSAMAHRALGCRGISRADFRYDEATGALVCLEVNTQPGMTETSLVPEMALHAGMSFGGCVKWMIEEASLLR